ncbi:MAG: ribonuclease E/G, partial [Gemmatimonadales bacterium]
MAILEDDRLVELLVDRPDSRRSVGDIYVGKVEAVLPGIQAAFVDIGAEKSAFLHASDLIESEEDEDPEDREPDDADEDGNGGGNGNGGNGGGQAVAKRRGGPPRERARRRPAPNIADELKRGQTKLVQVIKEAIGTKGPRVTAQVSLAGRFLVYMPFASKVGVSRKIDSREQRARLREMVSKLVPADSGGWIIRTVADDLTEASCKREIEHLLGLWKKIKRKASSGRAPALVQRETSLTRGIVRDLLSDSVDLLLVDSKLLYNEIEQ